MVYERTCILYSLRGKYIHCKNIWVILTLEMVTSVASFLAMLL